MLRFTAEEFCAFLSFLAVTAAAAANICDTWAALCCLYASRQRCNEQTSVTGSLVGHPGSKNFNWVARR